MLSLPHILRRNFTAFRREQLLLILGCALMVTVLAGAMMTGDSLSASLKTIVENRLGHIESIIQSEIPFTATLADGIGAPVFQISAFAETDPDHIHSVNLCGIDSRFFSLSPSRKDRLPPTPGMVGINRATALALNISIGDELILRVMRDALPAELPLADWKKLSTGLRVTVSEIIPPEDFGNFNLTGSQREPLLFLAHRDWLTAKLNHPNRANLIACDTHPALNALRDRFTLEDLALTLTPLPNSNRKILKSDRFLISDAVAGCLPGDPLFGWIANRFENGEKHSPYALVLGCDDLPDTGIRLISPLAADLSANLHDRISLYSFAPDTRRRLHEQKIDLTFCDEIQPDSSQLQLMPEIPGITDAVHCSEWSTGFPIDFSQIRDSDRLFWKTYGAIPKAYLSYATARKLWRNRYGSMTGLLLADTLPVNDLLREKGSPEKFGLLTLPLREESIENAENGVDFKGLFVGLSFLVMAGAALLWIMLYALHLQSRQPEIALLRLLGWSEKMIHCLFLCEAAVIGFLGSLLGLVAGIPLALLFLALLRTVWNGITGTPTLSFNASLSSAFIAFTIGFLLSLLTAAFSLRRKKTNPAAVRFTAKRQCILWGSLLFFLFFFTITCKIFQLIDPLSDFLLRIAMLPIYLLFVRALLIQCACSDERLSLWRMAIRHSGRLPGQTLSVISMIAIGLFLTVAVGSQRISTSADGRLSGSGGFSAFTSTVLPIQTTEVSDSAVTLRVRRGAEADCLNLNRVRTPQIFGVPHNALKGRFSFTDPGDHWGQLDSAFSHPNIIPAIADAAVIQWSLQLKLGDDLPLIGDDGSPYKLRLCAALNPSLFQGGILISETNFLRLFPQTQGYHLLLSENDPPQSLGLRRLGAQTETTAARLQSFDDLQNRYLMIFMQLGFWGLLIAALGAFTALLRNLRERHHEFILFQALGYSDSQIKSLVIRENAILLLAGIAFLLFLL